ncbi:hypothetical protein PIB30_025479 [Stylosanthes scabra]|uniref:CCHC-type domain-containing protein n=1 Tax=Stylosanthes scabra TaxID=79078 RepID=A0ABU6W826_9FABA|nr:hypothetical protein [Stylosanthes scabra]
MGPLILHRSGCSSLVRTTLLSSKWQWMVSLVYAKLWEADYRAGASATNEANGGRATVRDPVISKPKGAPKQAKKSHRQTRLCSRCKLSGHTKRNCPSKKKRKRSQMGHQEGEVAEGGQTNRTGIPDELKILEFIRGLDEDWEQ